MLHQRTPNQRIWHGRSGTSVICRPRLQHAALYLPQAASSSGGADEPGVSKQDLDTIYSQQIGDVTERVKFPMTVPLLPFPVEEVLLPGSIKSLHLFEARYLKMVSDILDSPQRNKFIGHVVVEQPGNPVGSKAATFPGAFVGDNLVFLMGTLVRVLAVKRLQVGVLVHIQAEARISVTELQQSNSWAPYMRATVVTLLDEPLLAADWQQVHHQAQQLTATMQDVQNLAQKFRTKQTAGLQQAMYWWEKSPLIPATRVCKSGGSTARKADDTSSSKGSSSIGSTAQLDPSSSSDNGGISGYCVDSSSMSTDTHSSSISSEGLTAAVAVGDDGGCGSPDLLERAARLSFAALQCTPEASPMEQLKLLRCRVNAMETSNTSARLELVQDHMQESQKLLAAKVAIKSLQIS